MPHNVTLSRSEGSVALGRKMLRRAQHDSAATNDAFPLVTLSRSEGSRPLGVEMLRGVYPECNEWAQHDSAVFLLSPFLSIPVNPHRTHPYSI